ncbi:MAG: xanthine dehydrogenase family protein molybdopterin-binding subunit [Proteobacteria bacterium]|nr:xanthine dehydrogenase family protein molybdopterin-binding subunit [Pseudomonadota bacterium]
MDQGSKQFKWIGTSPIRPDGVDKVTGRAKYGADYAFPNMLVGKVLRSPHAHARIKSIDTSAAEALSGVKAVITADDFPDHAFAYVGPERVAVNFFHVTRNIMAREKALYEGHAIAAVAATTPEIADEAMRLIKIDFEVLPHVIDVMEAAAPGAPLLHEDMITRGVEPAPTKPSNVSKVVNFGIGDVEAGFAAADEIVEMEFDTAAVHQGYIEPHACTARYNEDGQGEIWSSSQGHFVVRALTAKLTGMRAADLRVHPAEIGGGFGGKTVVYLEPLALMLSKKAGQAVRAVMTRDEVFKASGPTSGGAMTIKIGCTKGGKITAAEGSYYIQAGAFPGSPVINCCLCCFAPYDIENQKAVGYDVVSNRPKAAAYRAPGSPISAFGVESVLDILAKKIGMDPLEFRRKNGAVEGSKTIMGSPHPSFGFIETVEVLEAHDHMKQPLGPNQGRGVASGYWFNGGGESSATLHLNADGTAVVATGSVDVGGSRASMALMAAETLGIDYDQVRAIVADTANVGYTHVTGGSRVTLATGSAVIKAADACIDELRKRAALTWDVDVDGVIWEDGFAKPASTNVGDFEPLSLADITAKAAQTGGPIGAAGQVNAGGVSPGLATHVVDVEVDPETGKVTILRYTASQDVGRAIHPAYVEGQIQGGVVQGIGWALNEEYIYGEDGRLQNAGFLDYRVPVASDVPMVEAVMVEKPNPNHKYGVKGVGEVNICPPMAAIANAIESATGVRLQSLPMSPPRVLAALDAAKLLQAAE